MSTKGPTDQAEDLGTRPNDEDRHVVGLVANGSSGPWDIAIDETISGAAKWFAQVEGPRVYLYFEIPSLNIIDKMIEFINLPKSTDKLARSVSVARNGSLRLGSFGRSPVALVWDEEDRDHCFFTIGTAIKPTIRISLVVGELDQLAEALCQVRADLAEEGLL
jgi:hypothetical protein